MDMCMSDALSGHFTGIDEDVAAFGFQLLNDLFCQHIDEFHQFSGFFLRHFQIVVIVLFRHHQTVTAGRLGYVQDGQEVIVFIDSGRRDLSFDDVTEDTHYFTASYMALNRSKAL